MPEPVNNFGPRALGTRFGNPEKRGEIRQGEATETLQEDLGEAKTPDDRVNAYGKFLKTMKNVSGPVSQTLKGQAKEQSQYWKDVEEMKDAIRKDQKDNKDTYKLAQHA